MGVYRNGLQIVSCIKYARSQHYSTIYSALGKLLAHGRSRRTSILCGYTAYISKTEKLRERAPHYRQALSGESIWNFSEFIRLNALDDAPPFGAGFGNCYSCQVMSLISAYKGSIPRRRNASMDHG
jgi:hypothetical protein